MRRRFVRGGERPPGRSGELLAVRPFELHGTRYYSVIFRLDEDRDQAREARLSADMIHDGPQPGDRVIVESVLGVVDRIRKAEA
jgi:hypothetical protein